MNSGELVPSPEPEDVIRKVDLTQDEVIRYFDLLANPLEMDNETAMKYSVAGLYTPTNDVVLSVLDRLESYRAHELETPPEFERTEGDFLTDTNLRELNQLLKGVDEYEEQVEYTRIFMKSKHRKWAHRQRNLNRRRNL